MVAAALLDDQARTLELAVQGDAALVRSGRVVRRLEEQHRRQRAVGDPYRIQRLHRPVGARGVVPGVAPGHERRLGVDPLAVAAPDVPVARPLRVAALHGRVHRVPVVALGVDRAEALVRLDQGLVVLFVHIGRERPGQRRPVAVVVPARQERVVQLARAHLPARGTLLDRVPHPVPGRLDLSRVGAQPVRAVVLRHPGRERLVAGVERVVLGDVVVVPDPVRVHVRVEDQAPDAVREQLRVHRAQVGAVGVAQVVELPRSGGGPDHVEVLGRAHRVHVREQVRVLLAAGGREVAGAVPVGPLVLDGVRHRVGPYRIEVLRDAVQGRPAPAHAARVEPDHVVLGGTDFGSEPATKPAIDRPLPPGPPGLTSSGPWNVFAVCGIRDRASVTCRPDGSSWSSGARTDAHWSVGYDGVEQPVHLTGAARIAPPSALAGDGAAVTRPATVAPTANSIPERFVIWPPVVGEHGCAWRSPRRMLPVFGAGRTCSGER